MHLASGKLIRLAAIFGAAAVAIGAFGAHGLKPRLSDYQISIFEKGVQYQFYHALALLAVGILQQKNAAQPWLARAGWLFVAGMVGFSGSLYLLACRDVLPFGVAWAGPVTPLGGLCFLAGWAALIFSIGPTESD
jgi:uncharacterized membrane protein YgdD (TMEM256/DUF423 family)